MYNTKELYGLVGYMYLGKIRGFAKDLGLEYILVWRCLNNKVKDSPKFDSAFKEFCENNNLNIERFLYDTNIENDVKKYMEKTNE